MDLAARFDRCFAGLAAIGRDPAGGWTRLAWTDADRAARRWFEREAAARGLATNTDPAGNLWAWWGDHSAGGAVVTGSHLDTVPNGGAYDGALGVVCGLLAVEELQRSGVSPQRPLAVVAFADEEGGRFNTPTFGSRVLTGALDPRSVLDRTDRGGTRLADAVRCFGVEPDSLGAAPAVVGRIAEFVELHVEQGRAMADLDVPLALCDRILPHGRWRLVVSGQSNHAGTTRLEDRRDPTLVLAHAILEAHAAAAAHSAVATIGRVQLRPNAATSIADRVTAWLDCRADTRQRLDETVGAWRRALEHAAGTHSCDVAVEQESLTDAVHFDPRLAEQVRQRLTAEGWAVEQLPTAAGHDAGVLAARVSSAMLFVRNPTGVSHSPEEHATADDCVTGARALAAVLHELVA